MFTEEIRWAVLTALRRAPNLHIVTHRSPDTDGGAAAFLILNKAKRSAFSPNVKFHFVSNGDSLDLAMADARDFPGPKDLVIHLDTGGKIEFQLESDGYSPLQIWLDEHYEGCPYPSTTRIVFDLLYNREGPPPPKYARDIASFVDRVDSGNSVGGLDDADRETMDAMNDLLSEQFGDRQVARVIATYPGPTWISTLVHNQPSSASDEDHIRVMIYALESHVERARKHFKLNTFYDEHAEIQEINGVKLAVLPPNNFNTKALRGFLNVQHREAVDVFLTSPTTDGTHAHKGRYVIQILSHKTEVTGLREVRDSLSNLFPELRMHLDGEWALFIKERPGHELPFSTEELIDILRSNLVRLEVPTQRQGATT